MVPPAIRQILQRPPYFFWHFSPITLLQLINEFLLFEQTSHCCGGLQSFEPHGPKHFCEGLLIDGSECCLTVISILSSSSLPLSKSSGSPSIEPSVTTSIWGWNISLSSSLGSSGCGRLSLEYSMMASSCFGDSSSSCFDDGSLLLWTNSDFV